MEYPALESGASGTRNWKRVALYGGLLLFAVFWLAALPLSSPLSRARDDWWQRTARQNNEAVSDSTSEDPNSAAAGTITLTGTQGNLNLKPTLCISGHPRSFYGVSVADPDDSDIGTRVVLPESGSPHVTLSKPGVDDLVFDKNTCSTWDVDIHEHGMIYNIVEDLKGHANFDCLSNGAHLVGNLTLRSCH